MAYTVPVSDVLAAIKKVGVEKVVHFSLKKEKPAAPDAKGIKKAKTTTYIDNRLQLTPDSRPTNNWLYLKNLKVHFGLNDIAEKTSLFKVAEGKEKDHLLTLSGNHAGDYGEFIKIFNEYRDKTIPELFADKAANTKFWPMTSTSYSQEYTTDEKKKGQPFPDPEDNTKTDFRLRLHMDFKVIEIKRGDVVKKLPITVVKDFRTGKLKKQDDGTEIIEYDIATVDGVPVDETNIHKFITRDSTIEEMYVNVDGTNRSPFGIATKQTIREIVVNPKEYVPTGLKYQDNLEKLAKLKEIQEANAKKSSTGSSDKPLTDDQINEAMKNL